MTRASLKFRWRVTIVVVASSVTAVAVAVVLVVASASGTGNTRRQISAAARAPLFAVQRRDARALCGDFTPSAAGRLVVGGDEGGGCVARVRRVFAAGRRLKFPEVPRVHVRMQHVSWHGARATAKLAVEVEVRRGTAMTWLQLKLIRMGGRWRVATHARLAIRPVCRGLAPPQQCTAAVEAVMLAFAPTADRGGPYVLWMRPPPAVRKAGGRELRQFRLGRRVAAQSGCLACHRIGRQGNPGPGRDLTHIGSLRSESLIRQAIVDGARPMPSFRKLPPKKLRALVRFLALLRDPHVYRNGGGTMEPTLSIGSWVTVRHRTPAVGDIVVFHPARSAVYSRCGAKRRVPKTGGAACDVPGRHESSLDFVSRIVAGPGDEIYVRAGHVYRRAHGVGRFVRERDSYIVSCGTRRECNFPAPIRIPDGHWYLMGDNRGFSIDSRFWGPVPTRSILGVVASVECSKIGPHHISWVRRGWRKGCRHLGGRSA